MKHIILSSDNKKVISHLTFENVELAKKYRKQRIAYWVKFCKKNGNIPILSVWRKSVVGNLDFSTNFVDVEMSYKQETSKNTKQSSVKALKQYDENIIQRKVNRKLKNETRQYKKV